MRLNMSRRYTVMLRLRAPPGGLFSACRRWCCSWRPACAAANCWDGTKMIFPGVKTPGTASRAVHLVPGKGPCEGPPKCHSGRTAPLSPRGRQAVEILLQMYPDSPMLIPGPTGGIMRPDTWSRRLKAEMARMAEQQPDMPQLTAHELRHTYGDVPSASRSRYLLY